MSSYYQVCARYAFQKGKAQLVKLSFHTTSEYVPYLVSSVNSPLVLSRFFHSVPEAEHYINYLFTRHPTSTAPRPVLDAHQLLLF
jgi:hypothetical protein